MSGRIPTYVRRNATFLFVMGSVTLLSVLVLYLMDQKFNTEKRNRLIGDAEYDPQFREASRILAGMKDLPIEQEKEGIGLIFAELLPSGGVYYATPSVSGEPIVLPMETVLETLDGPIADILRNAIERTDLFFRAEFCPALERNPRVAAVEPSVTVEDLGKKRRANRFSNSLFTRDFENVVLYRMSDLGNVRLYYTSPLDAAWMPALVSRYRWYSLGMVAFWFVVVLALTSAMSVRRRRPPADRRDATNSFSITGGRC